MIFQSRFEELLRESGLTAKEFVSKFNASEPADIKLTESAISEIKNRSKERVPRSETIVKIAKFFNVSTDYLFGLSDTKTKNANIQIAAKTLDLSADVLELYVNYKKYHIGRYRRLLDFLLLDLSLDCERYVNKQKDSDPLNHWFDDQSLLHALEIAFNIYFPDENMRLNLVDDAIEGKDSFEYTDADGCSASLTVQQAKTALRLSLLRVLDEKQEDYNVILDGSMDSDECIHNYIRMKRASFNE